MGWIIRVGRAGKGRIEAPLQKNNQAGFEQGMNAVVTPSFQCNVTTISGHTIAQLSLGGISSNPASQAEHVFEQVLSNLVGM